MSFLDCHVAPLDGIMSNYSSLWQKCGSSTIDSPTMILVAVWSSPGFSASWWEPGLAETIDHRIEHRFSVHCSIKQWLGDVLLHQLPMCHWNPDKSKVDIYRVEFVLSYLCLQEAAVVWSSPRQNHRPQASYKSDTIWLRSDAFESEICNLLKRKHQDKDFILGKIRELDAMEPQTYL